MTNPDAMDSPSKDPRFVTALARGLDILRCFTPDRQELGTTEISKLTGLPQATVWRLCYTLQQEGCLMPGRSADKLRTAPGVLLLGHAAITFGGLGDFALPLMRPVADAFEASVSLTARDRHVMVIVQRSEASGIVNVNLHIGSSLSLCSSSVGGAWLAAVPVQEREAALQAFAVEHPDQWPQAREHVEQALTDYRKHGFVFNLGRSHPDINAIGVPVVSLDGRTVMALTCGGLRTRMSKDKLSKQVAPELKRLAQQLVPALGVDGARR